MIEFFRAACVLIGPTVGLVLASLVPASANAAPVRILWMQTAETRELSRSFADVASGVGADSGRKVEILTSEFASGKISDLYIEIQKSLGKGIELIFGLTLSQVQFLANNGMLRPVPSRDIKLPFSRSLYISASRAGSGSLDSAGRDEIIATPINVTLPVLCFDGRNERIARKLEGTGLSIEAIAGDTSLQRLPIPDPRLDAVGRAVLLSSFQDSSGFHDGWKTVDMVDQKVDIYSPDHMADCLDVASGPQDRNVDLGFATLDDVAMLRERRPSLSVSALRGGTPVTTLFAAVLRTKGVPALGDGDTIAVYRLLTEKLLERQIHLLLDRVKGEKVDVPLSLFYESGGTLSYKSSGQIIDEWAARYDYKSPYNYRSK